MKRKWIPMEIEKKILRSHALIIYQVQILIIACPTHDRFGWKILSSAVPFEIGYLKSVRDPAKKVSFRGRVIESSRPGGVGDRPFGILLIKEIIDAGKGLQPLPGIGELGIEGDMSIQSTQSIMPIADEMAGAHDIGFGIQEEPSAEIDVHT